MGISTILKGHWQFPYTVLNGRQLLLALCKGTVKESILMLKLCSAGMESMPMCLGDNYAVFLWNPSHALGLVTKHPMWSQDIDIHHTYKKYQPWWYLSLKHISYHISCYPMSNPSIMMVVDVLVPRVARPSATTRNHFVNATSQCVSLHCDSFHYGYIIVIVDLSELYTNILKGYFIGNGPVKQPWMIWVKLTCTYP